MYTRVFLWAFGILISGLGQADDPDRDELKRLEGTWKVVSSEASGKKVGEAGLGIDHVIFTSDRLALKNGDKEVASYGLALYPKQRPKGMDWINAKQKASLPVIYSVEGDELRLCFPLLKKGGQTTRPERPDSFDTEGKATGMIKAKRIK